MSKKPKYWNSWRGSLLRAIILDKAETWKDAREKSGLTQKQVFKVVGELRDIGVLAYTEDKVFQILDDDLRREYEAAHDLAPEKKVASDVRGHAEWIKKWIDTSEVNASLDHSHFFVEKANLAELSRRLMERAERSLHIVNPFVDGHILGSALRDAAKRGVQVTLVTRHPKNDKMRRAFHKTLLAEGVEMYYSGDRKGSGGAHSKIVIVDDEVVIVSSMNFTMSSEAGTWETGIASLEKDVVESALESVRILTSENETSPASDAHRL